MSDPIMDYINMINGMRATLPEPGQVTPQNMPLQAAHYMQSQMGSHTPLANVPGQTPETGSMQMQVGEPDIKQNSLEVGKPQLEEGQMTNEQGDVEAKLPLVKFNVNGHTVEAPEGSKTHKDLLKHLKLQIGKPVAQAEPGQDNSQFMEQLADAITKRNG